jgi:putative serine protease PepD
LTTVLDEDGGVPPPAPPRRLRPRVLIGVGLLWALVLTAVVLFRGGGDEPTAPVASSPTPSPSASGPLTPAQVYKTLLPSVVLIEATGGVSTEPARGANATAGTALGTGVIANADGTILTALHVVNGATAITVTYADGTRSAAKVATIAAAIDIATLTPATLPEVVVPATIGGGPAVGDPVVAIGNQLALADSATSGVVSGLNRSVSRPKASDLKGLIQFDAAVNPGSSGGPLLDGHAAVIGIIVALANPTNAGTFIGVGFAVPIGSAVGAGDGPAPRL